MSEIHGFEPSAGGAAPLLFTDAAAHKVGELAFLEAKLTLTPAQSGAFAHWKQVSLEIAQRHATTGADLSC